VEDGLYARDLGLADEALLETPRTALAESLVPAGNEHGFNRSLLALFAAEIVDTDADLLVAIIRVLVAFAGASV